MTKPGKTGLRRVVSATRYSMQGIRTCWRMEAAFRQELTACILLIPAALYFGQGGIEKALLIITCLLVPIVELLNSAVEAVVDRVSDEHHDLSGAAKDFGSAAVFLSILMFVITWTLLLVY